ncbi:MAG: glycosyltransferase family 10 domain-containing protein [Halothece sp.]
MRLVKVTFPYQKVYFWHLNHSAPNRTHQWGNIKFEFDPECKDCDAWVVWQSHKGLTEAETVNCPPNNTILVTREPPDVLEFPPAYLNQFGTVIAPDPRIRHRNHRFQQFGQVWHLEKDYNELLTLEPPEKKDLISSVTSGKSGLPGQKKRIQILEILQEHFGDRLHRFGRGVNLIKDKWDAIAPYKYHLTLENGQHPHYWSEKLADAYLGWCMPIYVGAPNILDYFEPESLIIIDPNDPEKAIQQIETAIKDDAWSKALPAIARARQRILKEYHLYAVLSDVVKSLPPAPKQPVTLYPEFEFQFPLSRRLQWRVRSVKKRLTNSFKAINGANK